MPDFSNYSFTTIYSYIFSTTYEYSDLLRDHNITRPSIPPETKIEESLLVYKLNIG